MRSADGSLGSGFQALFFGSLVSNTGDGIRLAALPLLATELTSSPILVSAVTAAQFLPWVSVAPVGGALVDRHDRRRLILEGIALAAMALSTSVAALAVIWLFGGLPAGVRIPVARSLQQRLTPNRLLGRVNVAARMFTRGIIVVGALASGGLAASIGLRWTFIVGGAIEIVAALLISRALRAGPGPTSTR